MAVTRLEVPMLSRSVMMAYRRKYKLAEVFGEKIPPWSFYRVERGGNEKPFT
ncbi:MAG: hypothetical protein MK316_09145 [Pseudomonadales bacterium]|nr:hypothetical protein [Pseudomonadales bacterium]